MSFQFAENYPRPYEKAQDEYRRQLFTHREPPSGKVSLFDDKPWANEQRRYIPNDSPGAYEQRRYIPNGSPRRNDDPSALQPDEILRYGPAIRYHDATGRLSREELMKHDPYDPAVREQIYREEAEKRRLQEQLARRDDRPSPRYPYYETSYREQFREKSSPLAKEPRAKERRERMVPGWYLFLRFDRTSFGNGFTRFKQSMLQLRKNINEGAKIVGLATPSTINIVEGGESWVKYGRMRQSSPKYTDTHMLILVLSFDTYDQAEKWMNTDHFFRHRDFPPPDGLDGICLPIYRMPTENKKYYTTMVLSEYPKITDPLYFREMFAIPSEKCIDREFDGAAYVVRAEQIDPETRQDPVVRPMRGSWTKQNSIVTVSLFPSPKDAGNYFNSRTYIKELKPHQDFVSMPTTIIMDLVDPLKIDSWM